MRPGSCLGVMAFAVGSLGGSAVSANETIAYTYDARGRLIKVVHSGSVNNNLQACYKYDKADNRVGDHNNDGRTSAGLSKLNMRSRGRSIYRKPGSPLSQQPRIPTSCGSGRATSGAIALECDCGEWAVFAASWSYGRPLRRLRST
jgi:hypothetical protein